MRVQALLLIPRCFRNIISAERRLADDVSQDGASSRVALVTLQQFHLSLRQNSTCKPVNPKHFFGGVVLQAPSNHCPSREFGQWLLQKALQLNSWVEHTRGPHFTSLRCWNQGLPKPHSLQRSPWGPSAGCQGAILEGLEMELVGESRSSCFRRALEGPGQHAHLPQITRSCLGGRDPNSASVRLVSRKLRALLEAPSTRPTDQLLTSRKPAP